MGVEGWSSRMTSNQIFLVVVLVIMAGVGGGWFFLWIKSDRMHHVGSPTQTELNNAAFVSVRANPDNVMHIGRDVLRKMGCHDIEQVSDQLIRGWFGHDVSLRISLQVDHQEYEVRIEIVGKHDTGCDLLCLARPRRSIAVAGASMCREIAHEMVREIEQMIA